MKAWMLRGTWTFDMRRGAPSGVTDVYGDRGWSDGRQSGFGKPSGNGEGIADGEYFSETTGLVETPPWERRGA